MRQVIISSLLVILLASELMLATSPAGGGTQTVGGVRRRMPARFRQRIANTRLNNGVGGNRPVRSEAPLNTPFLLMSTSSKLYCMRVPHDLSQLDDEKNIEIIYEEKSYSNSWITDAFYVKSEQLIYVNIYNSSSASSDIFTLRHDSATGEWHKHVLYKDQSYCLGIGYNEQKKELYWTAAKSIMTGSTVSSSKTSSPSDSMPFRVLFNLNMAKKLLYLKYDVVTDAIYVSTLNYVYVCPLNGGGENNNDWSSSIGDCRIIIRDLVSARGLHLDSLNRYLYVVDHKRRNIKRVKLASSPEAVFDPIDDENDELAAVETVISSESVPDLGDTFYMTLYGEMIIWSEFSGKVKIALTNSTSSYRTVFSTTSEYAYSVSIMDNSTDASASSVKPEVIMTTVPIVETTVSASTATIDVTSTPLPSMNYGHQSDEFASSLSINSGIEVEIDNNDSKEIGSYENQVETTTETPLYTWTRNRHTTVVVASSTLPLDDVVATTTTLEALSSSTPVRTTTRPAAVSSTTSIPSSTMRSRQTSSSVSYEARSITKSSSSTLSLITEQPKFVPKFDTPAAPNDVISESEDETSMSLMPESPPSQNSVQNLRSVNGGGERMNNSSSYIETGSTSLNLARSSTSSSSKLSLALYVVIGVLLFSLVLNIILLVVSKRKHLDLTTASAAARRHHHHHSSHREKLIIHRHEICGDTKSSESMPSQRSVLTSSKNSQIGGSELMHHHHECNLNLINSSTSNDSATSALDDMDHI